MKRTMILAIVCLVAATLIFKRMEGDRDLVVLNGGQLLAAGVVLFVPSLGWEPMADVHLTPTFLGAWLYLITGVSWLGMWTWFWLLRHGDATRASITIGVAKGKNASPKASGPLGSCTNATMHIMGNDAIRLTGRIIICASLASAASVTIGSFTGDNCYVFSCGPTDGQTRWQEHYRGSAFGV